MSNIFISDPNGEPISYYYQWDADQTVVISGLTISESPKVHFCNTTSNKSIVVKPLIVGNTITAKVPNILLQSTDSIIIYVYNTNADSGSRTIYTSRIAVIPRAKPEDYVYTETEVLQYSTLDARIRALENSVDGTGGCIYVGDTEPTDPNVGIWIDTSEKLTPPYIPNTTMAKPGQIVRVLTVDENGVITAVEAVDMPSGGEYALPLATAETLGGVKAEPATEGDTQPVRIGEDGMLYTKTGSGGAGDAWELIADITFEEQVNSFSIDVDQKGNPFSLKKYLLAYVWEKITDGEQSATYMFVIENNRQYGDNQPPLYTSALEVAQVNSLVGGMIYNELLPNHMQWGQAWRNTVQSSISVEPFRPIGSPQTNVMGKTVFRQHNDYLPFYQIGGKGAVMPKDSRVMLWGVRA